MSLNELMHGLTEKFGELIRVLRIHEKDSTVYQDPRFASWLATEARALVESGIDEDPWTSREADDFAERIRANVLAERSGVRRLAGFPIGVPAPEREDLPGVVAVPRSGSAPWVQLAPAAGIGREIWDEECDSWISVPEDLPLGKYVALNIRGDSMQPLLHDGDVVLVSMGSATQKGSIVLARTEDGYVVKRLERITTRGVYLGSLNTEHPSVVIKEIPKPIIGSVVARWCPHTQ
jgi:hypothetical protein